MFSIAIPPIPANPVHHLQFMLYPNVRLLAAFFPSASAHDIIINNLGIEVLAEYPVEVLLHA